jgi:hypothetical protein
MATKTKKTARPSAIEELADLAGAVEVILPPGAYLTICGMPQALEVILEAFERCRELLEAHAVHSQTAEEQMGEWPGDALDIWLFAKAVKAALIRYVRVEAGESRDDGAAARRHGTPEHRPLAAAKRPPTRQIRGLHLRKRTGSARGGRFPWVD